MLKFPRVIRANLKGFIKTPQPDLETQREGTGELEKSADSSLPADSIFPLTAFGDLLTDEKAVTTWDEFQEWVRELGPDGASEGSGKRLGVSCRGWRGG